MNTKTLPRRAALGLLAVAGALGMAGCVPLLVGTGATGAVLVAADRRTSGMQLEDGRIEQKFNALVREQIPEAGRLVPTSFNRVVLLTGEVRTADDKAKAQALAAGIENVRTVVNELEVVPMVSALGQRTKDAFITSKVKASFVDAKDLQANTLKVVTEQQVVYLMGIVTARESKRAAEIARGVNDVRKVVRVFEVITEDELARYQTQPAQPEGTDAPAAPGTPAQESGAVAQPVR